MSITSELALLDKALGISPELQRHSGDDWFQISDAECEVFGLSVEDIPRLVAVYKLYEAVLEITTEIAADRVQSMREELPWLPICSVELHDWTRFSALFGVSNRKAAAYYAKFSFWYVRSGLTIYKDEK